MPGSSQPKRPTRARLLIVLILIAGLLMPAIPAQAIVGSTPHQGAENYDYIGAAWLVLNGCCEEGWPGGVFPNPIPPELPSTPEDADNRVRTSGILIAPNVFLTQADSYRNGRRVAVSFENPIEDWRDGVDYLGLSKGPNPPWHEVVSDTDSQDTVYEGYVFHYPGQGDLAAIILDESVSWFDPDDAPRLAPVGALDDLKRSPGKAVLTAVSYGPDNFEPETWDFQRRTSSWHLAALGSSVAKFQSPNTYVCDGDQGAPFVDSSGDVAALLIPGHGYCDKWIRTDAFRLDTQEARDFLCGLSDGTLDLNDAEGTGTPDDIFDLEQVENPNVPLLAGYPLPDVDGNLRYDIKHASQGVLASYCGDSDNLQAASLEDSGKQSADDGAKQSTDGKHKSKHKKGGKHRGKSKHRR